jgi:hypothetical protein
LGHSFYHEAFQGFSIVSGQMIQIYYDILTNIDKGAPIFRYRKMKAEIPGCGQLFPRKASTNVRFLQDEICSACKCVNTFIYSRIGVVDVLVD